MSIIVKSSKQIAILDKSVDAKVNVLACEVY